MEDLRSELLRLLIDRSFIKSEREFTLTSGRKSRWYIDGKATTLHPRGAFLVGSLFCERLAGLDLDGVGGLTLGADPIATAIAVISGMRGQPLPAFIVRKEPKSHGTAAWIEGVLPERARVAVVDDVITTGGSIEQAIRTLHQLGHQVLLALALLDRLEGGRERLERAFDVPVEALFTIRDLDPSWEPVAP